MEPDEPLEQDQEPHDDSEDMDLVTVFEGAGASSEMEALSVQALLESNGIEAVLIGNTLLPNIPDEIRVPREDFERAQQLIKDALAAGPSGAQEAEAAGEAGEPTG
jgi:Putative prokaryotic signal transducing protein